MVLLGGKRGKQMKKKILVFMMAVAMSLSIIACGGSKDSDNPETKQEVAEVEKPTDLTGTWKSEENNGSYQEAIITADSIEINWVSDGGDTKSIYWIGTYEAPTEAVDEYSWTSERDKEATDTALLASTDDTKDFTYKDGVISYEASALGTTTKVELKKQKETTTNNTGNTAESHNVDLSSFSAACVTVGIDEEKIEDYFDMDGIITFTYNGESFSGTLNDDGSVNTLWYGESGVSEKWLVEDSQFVSKFE